MPLGIRAPSYPALLASYYIAVLFVQGDGAPQAAIAPRPLVDLSAQDAEVFFQPNDVQTAVASSTNPAGVIVTIQPGKEIFPGVTLKPSGSSTWDLSPFGHIEARITNLGPKPLYINLRIDGDTWENNSVDGTPIPPGQTVVAKVRFNYSYGKKAQDLNTHGLNELLIFNTKVEGTPASFRIESIQGAGVAGEGPPLEPPIVTAKGPSLTPMDGILLGPGAACLDPATNLTHEGSSDVSLVDTSGAQMLKVSLMSDKEWQAAGIKPANGQWRLSDSLEVRARVRNDGNTPITPVMEVDSAGGSVKDVAHEPLAPGGTTDLIASYINPRAWKNTPPALTADAGTGNRFVSDKVTQVLFAISPGDGQGTLTVESIKADRPPFSAPDWLGKRPPVAGDWTPTFDEEFDGNSVDLAKWNIYAENYWDPRCHFSRDNVIIGNGTARLRFEKKTGYQADDPTKKQTDYATGYLGTFGKFTQLYGYWEARMKVPTAPGLWPAFWLMPDRGEGAPDRETTENGGMEFDIMEYLSEWGTCRYNIAMHWDGYGPRHKSISNPLTYVQPDKDGFITAGLLWTPGSAVYYCNGKEVLHFENPRVSSVPSYILFDFVSGGWDNLPLDDAKLPADFVIDYVRVWQEKDLVSGNK